MTRPFACCRWRTLIYVLCGSCAWLANAQPAQAHAVPFSYVDLHLQPNGLDGSLIVHILDVAHDLNVAEPQRLLEPAVVSAYAAALSRLLASRLQVTADGRVLTAQWSGPDVVAERQALRFAIHYPLAGRPGLIAVTARMFPYDPAHQTFVNVYEGDWLTQAMLDRGRTRFDYFPGSRQGRIAVIRKFLPAGFTHILIGPDHLLFLAGLLLLGGSLRRIATIVTAFTIAHSVTLSLAALNIVAPPGRIVEPAIALSIVYVGAGNLWLHDGRDSRTWIAFAFGFIHGFGFASVLREMDLPARVLGWSLFSFNIGVELGQLMVVAVLATVFNGLRSRSEAAGHQLVVVGSLVVVAAGAFWFIQRAFFPGVM